jgi:hypothetical protein
MTTTVIIKSPNPNHNDLLVKIINPKTQEEYSTKRLTDGEEASLYVYGSQSLVIDEIAKDQSAPALKHEEQLINRMVDRFLGWKLPQDFVPDCGISFDGRKDDEFNKNKTWPIGTNLLTADQVREMFAYCLKQQ